MFETKITNRETEKKNINFFKGFIILRSSLDKNLNYFRPHFRLSKTALKKKKKKQKDLQKQKKKAHESSSSKRAKTPKDER